MGYTTKFQGRFNLSRPLTKKEAWAVNGFVDDSEYCQWVLTDDRAGIAWDGGEKFRDYVPWLKSMIESVIPEDVRVNGTVRWQGEDLTDSGVIVVTNNVIKATKGSTPSGEVWIVELHANESGWSWRLVAIHATKEDAQARLDARTPHERRSATFRIRPVPIGADVPAGPTD